MRLALATSAALPDLIPDEAPLRAALDRLGVEAAPAVWTDDAIDWSAYDAVLLRTTWDYTTKHAAFVAWAERVERSTPLFNPASVVRWNTHKRHLLELGSRGVRIVPMEIAPRGSRVDLAATLEARGWRECVVKPAVGATARRQERVSAAGRAGFLTPAGGQAHLDAALAEEDMLIQPYVASVESAGEASLVFIAGEFSHALRKRPAAGDYRVQADWGGRYEPSDATDDERSLAARTLGALREIGVADAPLLYARVDIVRHEGSPALIELEVVEPQLFFAQGPGCAERLAAAVVSAAKSARG